MSINLSNTLQLTQQQKLVLTTQLKQSLQILNMSRMEIDEEILKESEQNPLLDVERNEEEIDWEKYIKNMEKSTPIDRNEIAYNDGTQPDFENMVSSNPSFYDYLREQVDFLKVDDRDREILYYIVDSIDKDGYLRETNRQMARELGLKVGEFEKYLDLVHDFEPYGVGARDVTECLLIQIRHLGIKNKLIYKVVKEDLDLLAKNKLKDIAKKRKISIDKIVGIAKFIKTLNPRPGSLYYDDESVYVEPDVIVEKVGDEYIVELNEKDKFRLGVNSYYKNILLNTDDKEAKKYIKERLNAATNLIKNIESRKDTILKISKVIVSEQKEFFDKGVKFLKPLTMREIADEVDFHESTISRGVNGKYMLTPSGMFELRYFFSAAIETDDKNHASSKSIMSMIRDIIKGEDRKKPLSDSKITKMLNDEGINVARRTVAKYREELGILSSSKRKEF